MSISLPYSWHATGCRWSSPIASRRKPAAGFSSAELTIAGKWLEVLKEVAPSVTRFAVILNPDNPGQGGFQGTIEMAASSLGVQITPIVLRDDSEPERVAMERAVEAFARQANGGMIVLPDFATIILRQPIIALAARLHLPAVYALRFFVTAGGLVSWGTRVPAN
jgi:putative tryptophan/tyrosine transport system substrate-binding protein